jgi:hypothetical protein
MFARGLFLCLVRVLVELFPECLLKFLEQALVTWLQLWSLGRGKFKGIRGL